MGISLFDSNFESTQIDLPQDAFCHNGIILVPTACFLIVGGKVLDTGGYFVVLFRTTDDRCGDLTGNQWVFGIVFVVSSGKRISVNVESRCQPDIDLSPPPLRPSHRQAVLPVRY